MNSKAYPYTQPFYSEQEDVSIRAARRVVPYIMKLIRPTRVVDIGCGVGAWLSVFQKYGITEYLGIEGPWLEQKPLLISATHMHFQDLSKPIALNETYDLAVSLEVAEHIDQVFAGTFITSLVGLAPCILFSATIPFQGGTHHVNEQWPSYWAAIFKEKGYVPIDCLRSVFWEDKTIAAVYRQNMMLYVKKTYLMKHPSLAKLYEKTKDYQLDIVHPEEYLPGASIHDTLFRLIPSPVRRLATWVFQPKHV